MADRCSPGWIAFCELVAQAVQDLWLKPMHANFMLHNPDQQLKPKHDKLTDARASTRQLGAFVTHSTFLPYTRPHCRAKSTDGHESVRLCTVSTTALAVYLQIQPLDTHHLILIPAEACAYSAEAKPRLWQAACICCTWEAVRTFWGTLHDKHMVHVKFVDHQCCW